MESRKDGQTYFLSRIGKEEPHLLAWGQFKFIKEIAFNEMLLYKNLISSEVLDLLLIIERTL